MLCVPRNASSLLQDTGFQNARRCFEFYLRLGIYAYEGKCRKADVSIGVLVDETNRQCHQKNLDVEAQRPVVDVVKIQVNAADHLVEGVSFATETAYLGPSGDAGLDPVSEPETSSGISGSGTADCCSRDGSA